MEEWKPIKGYEGLYEVSNLGRVRSLERVVMNGSPLRRCVLKTRIMRLEHHYRGYSRIGLCKDNVFRHSYVQRLVAIAFIPNPESKPFVNHLDENKKNNKVSNLEWATESENTKYYYAQRQRVKESNATF